jgi:RIO kinase 1
LGKNKDTETQFALDALIEEGLIDDVLGVVKSGKEATVYCCQRDGDLIAAKVYRTTDVRRFSNDAQYRTGRRHQTNRHGGAALGSRGERAMEAKSRKGREFSFEAWVSAEYETLERLYPAGVPVPQPIARRGSIILMEYLGDEDAPAPSLSAVHLTAEEARSACRDLLEAIERSLAVDRIHADLSPFNVLYHDDRIRIIDYPQAVDARFNSNALPLLERDLSNMAAFFRRYGIELDALRLSRDLWSRFLRAEVG